MWLNLKLGTTALNESINYFHSASPLSSCVAIPPASSLVILSRSSAGIPDRATQIMKSRGDKHINVFKIVWRDMPTQVSGQHAGSKTCSSSARRLPRFCPAASEAELASFRSALSKKFGSDPGECDAEPGRDTGIFERAGCCSGPLQISSMMTIPRKGMVRRLLLKELMG